MPNNGNPVVMSTLLKIVGAVLGLSLGASGIIFGGQIHSDRKNIEAHQKFVADGVLCKTKIESIEKDVGEIKRDVEKLDKKIAKGFDKVLDRLP